jgi:TolB-like protein/DNA-binding winged helix-turn-helix (wHTH) protein/Tfp pilus assembly protein PilF
MPPSVPTRRLVRFGIFELDTEATELRKRGVKVKLQDQPFKVLQLLLERAGQIVTRDELRARVWPANTFVEFDQGLYSAMTRLRDALGDSSESPRFIETLARRGYRFIAPIEESPSLGDGLQVEGVPQPENHVRRFVVSVLAGLLGGALLLGVFLGFDIGGARGWLRRSSTRPVRSLAVLPLANLSGDPEQEYFVDGMTDELITDLARLGNVRVVSRTSVMRYRKTNKPLSQVGRELNVDAVVEGTVERSGNRVRIRVQLIDAPTDQHLWAQSYDRELHDTLLLQSEAARDIAREIQLNLTPQQRERLAAVRQVDPDAYEAYLRGIYFSNRRSAQNFKRAIEYFQQAIAKDPNYALAYSGLAGAFLGQVFTGTPFEEVREKATWAALKAVEIDPSLPEVHNSLAGIRELYDWDWSGAEKEYQRAIELNQNFAAAHQSYAIFLALQGRFDQALSEAQRSQELDPLSPFVRTTYCLDFAAARRYEQAIEKCRQALELDPDFLHAHGNLVAIYESMGMYDQTVEEYAITATIAGETPARVTELRNAFKQGGIRSFWRKQLELERRQPGGAADAYEVAAIYCRLGETNQAIEWLQKAYQEHSPHMEELKEEAAFDNLRSDPRFGDLLRRVGL